MEYAYTTNLRTKIGEGGRLIIPASLRKQLHLEIGDEVILHIKDDELYVSTAHQALAKLQAKVQDYMNKIETPFSLVETLLKDRRADARAHE